MLHGLTVTVALLVGIAGGMAASGLWWLDGLDLMRKKLVDADKTAEGLRKTIRQLELGVEAAIKELKARDATILKLTQTLMKTTKVKPFPEPPK